MRKEGQERNQEGDLHASANRVFQIGALLMHLTSPLPHHRSTKVCVLRSAIAMGANLQCARTNRANDGS